MQGLPNLHLYLKELQVYPIRFQGGWHALQQTSLMLYLRHPYGLILRLQE